MKDFVSKPDYGREHSAVVFKRLTIGNFNEFV